MTINSKKIDAIVASMMETCQKEGATVGEVRAAAIRFQREAAHVIEEFEYSHQFTVPRKEN